MLKEVIFEVMTNRVNEGHDRLIQRNDALLSEERSAKYVRGPSREGLASRAMNAEIVR
jgi:hypothetical protein